LIKPAIYVGTIQDSTSVRSLINGTKNIKTLLSKLIMDTNKETRKKHKALIKMKLSILSGLKLIKLI